MWIEEDGRRSGSRERTMWIEWEDDALCTGAGRRKERRRKREIELCDIQMCTRG
jgi:hypothetical protein